MSSLRVFEFLRPLLWSICVLGAALVVNACGSSEPVQQSQSTRTLRLTAVDSATGEPLDSARAINRTLGDTLRTDSAGQFVMRDIESALHVFDISGYGYHTQRHFAVLVEPTDTLLTTETSLLPQVLSLECEGSRPFGWDRLQSEYREDSSLVRIELLDVFAQGGQVEIQPILVNDLPTNTIFLPENFGALGHYDVLLYDGDNNQISFAYKNAPPDERGQRIYTKKDLRPVVPKGTERLEEATLVIQDSVGENQTLYARMDYNFSSDDTLRATSATTFPDLNLDSLQVPDFDTVRTDGRIRVPDSLRLQRDTTVTRVVGIDTTVTRSGYVLYSTLRDSNAASTPEAARKLLFIPDSVKARAQRDERRAIAEADTTVPDIDTTSLSSSQTGQSLYMVERTDRTRMDSLLTDPTLSRSLLEGLPSETMSADSLLAMSQIYRTAALRPPNLSSAESRIGVDAIQDTTESSRAILSAPQPDSLFEMISPEPPDADTIETTERENPFLGREPGPRLTPPDVDSMPIDSLRLTIRADADSVTTDSIVTNELSDPPARSYWFIPDSLSVSGARVLAIDPSFFQLRARPLIDTTVTVNVRALLPDRLGTREERSRTSYPQQVVRIPAGTYRNRYLNLWKKLQANTLKEIYCRIFPYPLRSEWQPASIR